MTKEEIKAHVRAAEYKWLDQIDIRNTSKYGSVRYWRAEDKTEEIENECSMLVFNDTAHTTMECLYEVGLWTFTKPHHHE
jgi:hypothetical protein